MQIGDLITPDHIAAQINVANKKRALEVLSKLLTSANQDLCVHDVLDALLARERLGTTALGSGIAIPHGRLDSLENPIGAFIQLVRGIDFDAPDQQPVDLLFALLVPSQANDLHLKLLAQLATLFHNPESGHRLRVSSDRETLYRTLLEWDTHNAVRITPAST